MTCLACGRQQSASRRFCISCHAFLADPAHAVRGRLSSRIAGFLVDLSSWLVALGVPLVAVFWNMWEGMVPSVVAALWFGALILLAQIVLLFRGQTIGKALFGLQVRHERTSRVAHPLRMIAREILSQTVSNVMALGYVLAFFNEDNQTLHDWMTNTVVVRRLKLPRELRAPREARTAAAAAAGRLVVPGLAAAAGHPAAAPPAAVHGPTAAAGLPVAVADVDGVPPSSPPRGVAPRPASAFTLDRLFGIVPAPVVVIAVVLVGFVYVRSEVRAQQALQEEIDVLGESMRQLATSPNPNPAALAIEPSTDGARELWTRYAASVDVRAAIDSAFAAHGLPQGFRPPEEWMDDSYLRRASYHASVRDFLERYRRFDESFVPGFSALVRSTVERRAAEAGVQAGPLRNLLWHAEAEAQQYDAVWTKRRQVVELGARLHHTLVYSMPRPTPSEAVRLPDVSTTRAARYELHLLEERLYANERAMFIF